jgi:hypothetical protein
MKQRHPRFRWHAKNWVIEHIAVMHLEAMRRLFKKPDPDLETLKQYEQLTAKGTIGKRKARPEPDSESESEVSLHHQYIPTDPSPIVQRPRKSST